METSLADNKTQLNVKPSSNPPTMKKDAEKLNEPSLIEGLADKAEWLKEETLESYDSSIQLIRKNPVTSIAIATGVGVAIGMFIKSRH
jgi:ElaB/YqjD/DUF883 family membrane-anchored ribosome-binding protein